MSIIDMLQPWTTAGVERYRTGLAKLADAAGASVPGSGAAVVPDPALFAYFARSAEPEVATLSQLTASWIPVLDRPAWVDAVAGPDGYAHLPGLGYARADVGDGDAPRTARTVLAGLEPEERLTSTLHVITHDLPTVAAIIESAAGRPNRSVAASWRQHGDDLHAAWDALERLDPALASLLDSALQQVILFQDDHCNSFADAAYFGAAFCNMALGPGPVFLVEDLVHQGGHNVLMAAACDPAVWFTRDPSRERVDGASDHGRNLYVLWHGTVTEALMADVLMRWLSGFPADRDTTHELRGRYAFVLKRYSTDLAALRRYGTCMTAAGRELLDGALESWSGHVRTNGTWVDEVDLTGQGYNFSYELYRARNPMGQPRVTAAGASR